MTNIIPGTSSNDDLPGTKGADEFDLQDGGDDAAHGLAGNDVFFMAAALTPADHLFGGKGFDTVELQGQAASHLTYTSATFDSIEQIDLFGALNYSMMLDDTVVAAGATMTVDTTTISSGHIADVNASGESNGRYVLRGGAGADIFFAGAGDDVLNGGDAGDQLHLGTGHDQAYGGEGDDLLIFNNGALTTADHVDGGVGFDTVYFGNSLTVTNSTFVSVESVFLEGTSPVNVDFRQLNTSAITFFQVQAYANTGSVTVNTAGLNKPVILFGSDEDDLLIGGNSTNRFEGGGGADRITGGPDVDRYDIAATGGSIDSTGPAFDTINGFNAAMDVFGIRINGSYVSPLLLDDPVIGGRLRAAHFDHDLAAAIGADELGAADAVLFKAGKGSYKGDWFLIFDANGVGGYQAGQDIVVRLHGAHNLDQFDDGNFVTSL